VPTPSAAGGTRPAAVQAHEPRSAPV
jgi:hypothetical protein